MKKIHLIVLIIIFFTACRGGENKKDQTETVTGKEIDTSTTIDNTTNVTDTATVGTIPIREPEPPKSSKTSVPEKPARDPNVLARIDQHLVSTPKFTANPGGGISNASVSVKNTMTNASFQKIFLEVSILNSDNSLVRTDYHTMVNLEPGDSKQVPITNSTQGSKIVAHVVKVKSNELTNGESVMTGAKHQQ